MLERYQVKNLNQVFDFLLGYKDSHFVCEQFCGDFFTAALGATLTNMQVTQPDREGN